ncbi:MAG: sulfite exporter TauE/SafE family protein [Vicinamibacterales bacterium]
MDVAGLLPLLGLFAVGVVSGTLNVVAGGGSFLTLPALLFLGLPAGDANGTNRIGVLAQNLAGVWGFHRSNVMDWRWAGAVSVPAMAGAAVGAWLALQLSDFAFKRLLSLTMLGMTLWTLVARPRGGDRPTVLSPWHPGMVVAFALIGLYAGFIQAGVGFAILAATSIAGMDLVRGNAVKLLSVLLVTLLSLAIFAAGGAVQWAPGLALGLGNAAGAMAGVRLAVSRGHAWIHQVVTAAVVLMAVLLWFDS